MEVYRRKTREIVWRFLRHRLTFPQCIELLDSALADVEPRLTPEELPALRVLVLANNEMVMLEMERRGPDPLAPPRTIKGDQSSFSHSTVVA
jgi:hypothetical protein